MSETNIDKQFLILILIATMEPATGIGLKAAH